MWLIFRVRAADRDRCLIFPVPLGARCLRDVYMNYFYEPHHPYSSIQPLRAPSCIPVMVGCKDDPSHKLRNLPLLHQQSPTQDEQDTRLDRWFHTLSHTLPRSPLISTAPPTKIQDEPALDLQSVARSHPTKQTRLSTNAQSNKRKALAELEPSHPRKSARLEQRQRVPPYQMPTSPSKKKMAGKAREAAAHTQNKDETNADVNYGVRRGRSQSNVPTESSSDKENRDMARGLASALARAEGAEIATPLLQPVAVLVPPELGSPPKHEDPSSRPSSPTKSTSTKTSEALAQADKRERLALLNPPVQFFTRAHLGKLGGKIQPLVKKLWVDYIELDDEGYIPQALKVRRTSSHTGTDTEMLCRIRQEYRLQPQINRHQAFTHLHLQRIPNIAKMIMRGYG